MPHRTLRAAAPSQRIIRRQMRPRATGYRRIRPRGHLVQQAHRPLVRYQLEDAGAGEHGRTLTSTRPSSKAIAKSSATPRARVSSSRKHACRRIAAREIAQRPKARGLAVRRWWRAVIADAQTGQIAVVALGRQHRTRRQTTPLSGGWHPTGLATANRRRRAAAAGMSSRTSAAAFSNAAAAVPSWHATQFVGCCDPVAIDQ